MKIIPGSFILLLLIQLSYSSAIYYTKIFDCLQVGQKSCLKWNNTISLFYDQYFVAYMCFPERTYVLGQYGIKHIKDLSVGDKILSYNFESNRAQFTPVDAWLHRDTQSETQFSVIQTKAGYIYKASYGHNIAFNNQDGKIGFKEAQKIGVQDELISIEGVAKVTKAGSKIFQKGLYSPITSNFNFFIFGTPKMNKIIQKNDQMILVHCLSDIQNPHKKENIISNLLKVAGFFGLNKHKNLENEEYLHPVTHFLSFFSKRQFKAKHLLVTRSQNYLLLHHRSSSSSNSAQRKRVSEIKVFSLADEMNSLVLN